jgi:tetratricopeptide (TPR) repeat protein
MIMIRLPNVYKDIVKYPSVKYPGMARAHGAFAVYTVCAAVFMLFFFAFAANLHAAASPVGKLEKAVGTVEVAPAGQKKYKAAKEGMDLFAEDKVKTGKDGKAVVKLIDGSALTLAEATTLKLDKMVVGEERKGGVHLLDGTVRAAVSAKGGIFNVATKNSIAGVKGTEFTAMTKGKASFYFQNEGAIEVTGGDSSVELSKDMMTENYQGRKPIEPIDIKDKPDLQMAMAKLLNLTTIEIPPSIKDSELLEEILVRWTINYAHYLADAGKFYEAETLLNIAKELTARDSVKSEILMQVATIYSRFFKQPKEAYKYYDEVVKKFPKSLQYESALYNAALSLYEAGENDKSAKYFNDYIKKFPEGRYRQGVDYYLKK